MHTSSRRFARTASSPVRRGRGRPAGISKARQLQRLVIAEALVQGVRIATLPAMRVSRSWASREANAPQTRVLLASLLANRAESTARQINEALDVIDDAFDAVKIIRHSNLQLEVPDHRIRLEAGSLFLKLVSSPGFSGIVDAMPFRVTRSRPVAPTSEDGRGSRSAADHKARFEAVRLLIRMLSKV